MATYHCPQCGADITAELSAWETVATCPKCGENLDTQSAQFGARLKGVLVGALIVGAAAGFTGQEVFFRQPVDNDPTPAIAIGLSSGILFLVSGFVSYKFAGKPAGNLGCLAMVLLGVVALVLVIASRFV